MEISLIKLKGIPFFYFALSICLLDKNHFTFRKFIEIHDVRYSTDNLSPWPWGRAHLLCTIFDVARKENPTSSLIREISEEFYVYAFMYPYPFSDKKSLFMFKIFKYSDLIWI